MILKFDHIAFSCRRSELTNVLQRFSDYEQVFFEKNVLNIAAKKKLLSDEALMDHDIVLLQSVKTGDVPIEITAYDVTAGPAKYDVDGQTIIAYTDNVAESSKFYETIGFKKNGDNLQLKTLLDAVPFNIKLCKTEHYSYMLDGCGFCCIALVINNAEKEKKRLDSESFMTTEINELVVNNNMLKIFFAYNQSGDKVEYIQINNRKANI